MQVQTLLTHLAEQEGMDLRRLGEHLALHEPGRGDRWTWLARRLVQEELIRESNDGAQRLYLRDSARSFLKTPWPLDYAA
jgi:ATP-dependent DNA helicase RecQ